MVEGGSAGTAFEIALYEVLARVAPNRVLTPIATDAARSWIVLPDGGSPLADLTTTLEIACRVAKIARVLTWERALQAAREQGEEIADDWANAPVETLASLLDESYLGGP